MITARVMLAATQDSRTGTMDYCATPARCAPAPMACSSFGYLRYSHNSECIYTKTQHGSVLRTIRHAVGGSRHTCPLLQQGACRFGACRRQSQLFLSVHWYKDAGAQIMVVSVGSFGMSREPESRLPNLPRGIL